MKNKTYESYAIFFETLGHQTRLRIINVLRDGPANVTKIINQTGMEQTCVSHCLRRLERCGFVSVTKEGKFRVYELNHATIEPLMALVDKHTQTYCVHLVGKGGNHDHHNHH